MAKNKTVPTMRRHKATGQAVVTLSDANTGRRVDRYCGKYGTTDAAKQYAELVEKWEKQGRTLPGKPKRQHKPEVGKQSVARLALDYLAHTRRRGVGDSEVRALQGRCVFCGRFMARRPLMSLVHAPCSKCARQFLRSAGVRRISGSPARPSTDTCGTWSACSAGPSLMNERPETFPRP